MVFLLVVSCVWRPNQALSSDLMSADSYVGPGKHVTQQTNDGTTLISLVVTVDLLNLDVDRLQQVRLSVPAETVLNWDDAL